MNGQEEKRFFKALKDLFTGAEVEGDSGFVNLMHIKQRYFVNLCPKLREKIDGRVGEDSKFREELFDKLYTFFSRYFCESGSVYFRNLPALSKFKVYEQVYQDGRDVALSWKTQMLYYVKSDILVRSMPVTLEDEKTRIKSYFYFDATDLQHKKNNERHKGFVFTFSGTQEQEGSLPPRVCFDVAYSQKNSKTKIDDIIKEAGKSDVMLWESQIEKAIKIFCRQTEVDFFINKDARGFLRDQFDLWLYQYVFKDETLFIKDRIGQLQALKDTAYDIIDFIAQFEDELCKLWEKRKFVRGVNYVVTIDKLTDGVVAKLAQHKGMSVQMKEWRELAIIDDDFSSDDVRARKAPHLPVDTKHFKDMELEILAELGNLDENLDGELVHSENWQALNSLQKRYQEQVQCIYIDPPFNLDTSDQFLYRTNYKDSNWATILDNRLQLAKQWLNSKGGIFLRCDYHGNWIARYLLSHTFGEGNLKNEIILSKSAKVTEKIRRYHSSHDSLFFAVKSETYDFEPATKKRENSQWRPMHLPGVRWSPVREYVDLFSEKNIKEKRGQFSTRARIILGKEMLPPEGRHWALSQEAIFDLEKTGGIKFDNGQPKTMESAFQKLTDNWTDWVGYSSFWGFTTENNEKIIGRAVKTSSLKERELVLDFFLGSGTTTAVAHKLGRKWLGVEMGEHFHCVILPRMKKVLGYDKTGISKDVKDYQGGGAFKYYTLEQYEEALKNAHYGNGEQLELDSDKSPFAQYVFFGDDKLAHVVKRDKDTINIALDDLYPDIDIGESLANILGKPIRSRTADKVTFADGSEEKIDPATMTEDEKRHFITLIKPYLWWGNSE